MISEQEHPKKSPLKPSLNAEEKKDQSNRATRVKKKSIATDLTRAVKKDYHRQQERTTTGLIIVWKKTYSSVGLKEQDLLKKKSTVASKKEVHPGRTHYIKQGSKYHPSSNPHRSIGTSRTPELKKNHRSPSRKSSK
jgi:hypothetical protein